MFSKLIANAAYTYMIYTTSSQRANCPQRCHIVRLKEVTKSAKYDCSLPNHFCTTSELRHINTTIFLRSRHLQTRCQWVNMNPQRNNVLQHKLNQLIQAQHSHAKRRRIRRRRRWWWWWWWWRGRRRRRRRKMDGASGCVTGWRGDLS